MAEHNYGNIMDIPASSDILLNFEYMNCDFFAHATVNPKYKNKNIISLNPILFADHKLIYHDEVIPHELAHIICFNNGIYNNHHGNMWQDVCQSMGGSGNQFINTEN